MKTFIVVEDDLSIRYMLKESLKALGHETLAAVDNIASAMQLLKTSRVPDIILLDIILPGGPGTGLIEYVKTNHKAVKIILVTGLTELQVLKLAPEGGYDALLQKPFHYKQLAETISLLESPPGKSGGEAC